MDNSGLQNFLLIATKPDNIPIAGMLAIVFFLFGVAIFEMVKHDRHIKKGEKEKVYDDMIK